MGLPTAIVANMTSEQLEAYTLHLRIEEISQKLRIDDVVPADGDRLAPYPALLWFVPFYRVLMAHIYCYRIDLPRLHRSMITMAVVSIHGSTATGSVSKTNATS